jgi:uncharacterized protein
MSETIPLRRPGAEIGDRWELRADLDVEPFDLYGRHHEVADAEARAVVTRLSEGLHLDLEVRATVRTTCDRTLKPVELRLLFGDSEFLHAPNSRELSVEDWAWNAARYAERALPSEVPMQVFSPDTKPVEPEPGGDEIDPRWRGLDGLSVSGL